MNEKYDNEVNYSSKNKNKFFTKKKIMSLLVILEILTFLILGFCFKLWHPGWIVFLISPVLEIIMSISKKQGKRLWKSLAVLVSVVGYLILGFGFKLWHPGWLIFFLIPIVEILASN